MSDLARDVLIIGGGVIGLAAAEALSREGQSVALIDAGELGRGASHGNCGLVTPSHVLPLAQPGVPLRTLLSMFRPDSAFYLKPRLDLELMAWGMRFFARCSASKVRETARAKRELLALSRRALANLIARERLDCEWQERGLYHVFRTREGFAGYEREAAWLAEAGIEGERLDGAALRARVPELRSDVVGAHFYAMDAHLRPDRLIAELARVLRARGVALLPHTPATRIDASGDRIGGVDTPAGRLEAREYVLASGSGSPALVRPLGLRLPIQPGKGYSITFELPSGAPRTPLLLCEPHVAITPWSSGLRIGSTMEFAGFDARLDRRRIEALLRGARAFLTTPLDAAGIQEEWCGWRPMTPDDLPILGRPRQWSNLVLAAGHSMLGVTNSAGTAQLIAAEVLRQPPPIDPAPYRVERF
jgi:D-amino-acid dehydrogenase